MLRTLLLLTGGLLFLFTELISDIPAGVQYAILIAGILLLGIPHGAADLLVAAQNSSAAKKSFSTKKFLITYLSRLFAFAVLLYFFPVPGICFFLFFSAYHFGETDLYQFKTNGLPGKLLAISYGWVLLNVLLVNNLEELKPMVSLSGYGKEGSLLISAVEQYRDELLSLSLLLFFCSVFVYFHFNKNKKSVSAQFLIHFAGLVLILYHLPLLLGFTFYFVIWHSVLSLHNIMGYLRKEGRYPFRSVVRQLILFSFIALAGIVVAGIAGYMFSSHQALLLGLIGGLAVLTAPHMQVMHDMYSRVRNDQ